MKPSIEHPHHRLTLIWPLPARVQQFARTPVLFTKSSLGFFGCSVATNTTRKLILFGWQVMEYKRLEYADPSDAERAAEYLKRWSECEKELQGYRIAQLGLEQSVEIKKLIKESLGVDLDEGTTH